MNTFPPNFLSGKPAMRWIGDVHGSLEVDFAIDDAIEHNYALGFIGDLTDQSPHDTMRNANDSAHVLRRVSSLVRAEKAVIVPGNHCAKLYRYLIKLLAGKGEEKDIKTSHGMDVTIEEIMTSEDRDQLIEDTVEMYANAPLWHRGGSYVFVHAGAVGGMFNETPPAFRDAIRKKSGLFHRALYGQTDGTTNESGFPVRRYDWVDALHAGETVVIGHDIRKEITTVEGSGGGRLIHIDTGSGKSGHLSWLDIPTGDLA